MTQYLCYDLRAIQTYIFRVPKLKYIVGGSALVDRFDRVEVPRICKATAGCTHVFSGGGKGTIACQSEQHAKDLEQRLLKEAHRYALDIRLGLAEDFSTAAQAADRLYSFVPSLCEGHPCQLSGLYPTPAGSPGDAHESIRRRIFDRSEATFRHFEERLHAADLDLGPGFTGKKVRFVTNIDADDAEGRAGRAALGRNRWAVICMDGNDMGRQYREAQKVAPNSLLDWIPKMSQSLDRCAMAAATAGIERAMRLWSARLTNQQIEDCTIDGEVVIPIRPLVVGGDDIVMLCHPAFAFEFVRAATTAWAAKSEQEAKSYGHQHGLGLWPATGSSTSISAGVLFCPATLPVHSAIPYAESLLASAKHRGRGKAPAGTPTPPTIDWESVVESMLDTPAARRKRELTFRDLDVADSSHDGAVIELTHRPYLMSEFEKLLEDTSKLKRLRIPRTILSDVLPGLRQARSDRSLYTKRIAKNHKHLAELMNEAHAEGTAWSSDGARKRTWLPDAISILDESERHEHGDSHD
jgi:hypothetical protein